MSGKRHVGLWPATGWALPAVVFAMGLSTARGDELSDLRANQELLQQRLDQLAQIPAPGAPYPGGPPPASAGQALVGGSFPRSWLIPGTDTSIRVGGEIREVFDYWIIGGPPNGSPQSTGVGTNGQLPAIPFTTATVARARSHSIFQQSPRESKLNVETRTPTPFGEARTFMEFDWAGSTAFSPGGNPTQVSDNLAPRLRFAYGTLGGILAGQANSNFADPDANPETLDFAGNVGEPGVVRIPQIRYTMPLAPWGFLGALSFSAETPETDAAIAALNGFTGVIASDTGARASATQTTTCTTTGATTTTLTTTCTTAGTLPTTNPTKAKAPDLTAAWYIPQPWGHVDFSLVVRPGLQFNDGAFVRRDFVGYGGHIGMDFKPGWFGWEKDDIAFHAVAGEGIGRYLNCNCNFALASNYGGLSSALQSSVGVPTLAGSKLIRISTTFEFGSDIGYTHFWMPNLRSTVSGGMNWHDIPAYVGATQRGALNKLLVTGHANLIWSPVAFINVGFEYAYGYRRVVSNLHGDEHALISRFAVRF